MKRNVLIQHGAGGIQLLIKQTNAMSHQPEAREAQSEAAAVLQRLVAGFLIQIKVHAQIPQAALTILQIKSVMLMPTQRWRQAYNQTD